MIDKSKLALFGGAPIRTKEFFSTPMVNNEEIELVNELMKNNQFSKFVGSPIPGTYEILNKKDTTSNYENTTLQKAVNKTVYNVTKNLDNFQYNVVIANIHEIYNLFYDHVMNNKTSNKTLKNEWEKITMLLMPLVPHLAHECSEKIIKKFYWPKYDLKLLKEENCTIVIQVDGRKRGVLEMSVNSSEKNIIIKNETL